jgi:hypothetical protein
MAEYERKVMAADESLTFVWSARTAFMFFDGNESLKCESAVYVSAGEQDGEL